MSIPYVYMSGCVAVGGACYLASKVFNRNGPPQVADEDNTNSQNNNLDKAPGTANVESRERAEILEIELNKTKAALAELQMKYHDKYDVDLTNLSSAKDTSCKPSSSKKRRECVASDSSPEGTAKAATVILTSKLDQKSTADGSVYTDAENLSANTGFSEEEGSVQKDILAGKTEVESNEKVEKWLNTNMETATNLTHEDSVRNEKHIARKPVAMTIPARDPPRSKKTLDKDVFDACETYASSLKRDCAKKNAPHLYKRLNLRKKSTVALEESKTSKSKSRKSGDDNGDMPSKCEENSKKTDVPKKSIRSEPDLRIKKHGVKTKYESDGGESTDHDGSDSEHLIESNDESSDECASSTTLNENIKEKHGAVPQRSKISSPSPAKCPPNSSANLTSGEKAKRHSSCQKLKQSQTRLKNKIDEVLSTKSKSFVNTKISPARNKRSESPGSLGRTALAETKRSCSENPVDSDSDGEVIWATKPNSAGTKGEFYPTALERVSSANQEESKPDGPDSGEEADRRIESSMSDKKKEFADKNIMKLHGLGHDKPTKPTNLSDKTHGKKSGTNERPKTPENDMLSAKKMNEKSKEFLAKYRLRDSPCQERPKLADREELSAKVNPFDKRKEFQAKYYMKENSGMDGRKLEENDILSAKSNQFEKRKEFQAKYSHMRDSPVEDGPDPSEKVVLSATANFDKKKEFHAKYHLRGSRAIKEGPKLAGTEDEGMKPKSQHLLGRSRSRPHEDEEPPSTVMPEIKRKELGNLKAPISRRPAEKEIASGKAEKPSPLKRRMEYDAKCRMKSVINLHRRNSVTNESLRQKASLFEKKQGYNTQFRMKDTVFKLDSPAKAGKLPSPSSFDENNLIMTKESPTMNRQPNDETRKAYLFDWKSKCYAAAPEIMSAQRAGETRKPRGSSIPPSKGKTLPRVMKRPVSADVNSNGTKLSSELRRTKNSPSHRTKYRIDSDDEDSSEDDSPLGKKSSDEWGLSEGGKPSLTSLDLEFDPKDLNDSYFYGTTSEVTEETMVKELQRGPLSENVSDEEAENETVDAMVGEFILPKCQSDFLPNECNTRPKLQNILDLPMSCSGATINDNLLSRSETRIGSDDEGTPSNHVFNGTKALNKAKKTTALRKRSAEVISVRTDGFLQLAMDEILNET